MPCGVKRMRRGDAMAAFKTNPLVSQQTTTNDQGGRSRGKPAFGAGDCAGAVEPRQNGVRGTGAQGQRLDPVVPDRSPVRGRTPPLRSLFPKSCAHSARCVCSTRRSMARSSSSSFDVEPGAGCMVGSRIMRVTWREREEVRRNKRVDCYLAGS